MSLLPAGVVTVADFLALCASSDRIRAQWEQATGTPWPSLEAQLDTRDRMERGER